MIEHVCKEDLRNQLIKPSHFIHEELRSERLRGLSKDTQLVYSQAGPRTEKP